jgi:hypothetical protein
MDAWRLKTWNIIHEAAYNSFLERRSFLRDKASELEEELASQDSLSLRKMEREEIMKVVLRWLFGPMFKFNPDTSTDPSYNTSDDLKTDHMWKHTLYYGELIKFLHQAIEWENMLYFLYPYFWSHRSRWELKKGLDHPDAIHKAFLKSGAARVVLPVRPGFEKDFVSFVETGTFNPLLKGHPYLTIAEEIENYAKTEYPGMPSANPIEDARPLLHPKQKKAWEDMQKIMQLIELYRSGNSGKYPSQLSDLASFGSIQSKDPWGNDYVYIYPGEHSTYDLFSRGKNGILGGTEEDEDITNWATASLIAIWYEYTPTGAVDIEFDTGDVPNA